jgi:hypothetical protein
MSDPFTQLLAWRAARAKRDVTLASLGPHRWLCQLYNADERVAVGEGRTHAVAILNALSGYGEPNADAGGAK